MAWDMLLSDYENPDFDGPTMAPVIAPSRAPNSAPTMIVPYKHYGMYVANRQYRSSYEQLSLKDFGHTRTAMKLMVCIRLYNISSRLLTYNLCI